MKSVTLGPNLIGRPVRIIAWTDLGELFQQFSKYGSMPSEPVGVVTGLGDYGAGHLEVQVRVSGFVRPLVFDAYELELLS